MLPDRVSNPGPLTYESGALPIALRGPAHLYRRVADSVCHAPPFFREIRFFLNMNLRFSQTNNFFKSFNSVFKAINHMVSLYTMDNVVY